MGLISVVLSLKDADSSNMRLLKSPLLQGELSTLGWLPPWPAGKSAAPKPGFFLLQQEFLPLLPSLGLSLVMGGSFHPVLSFQSWVILPKIVVTWLCSWEEVSSMSAHSAILMRCPFLMLL